jgi:hypothetical protein
LLIQDDPPLNVAPQKTLTFSMQTPSSSFAVTGWRKLLVALSVKSNGSSQMSCSGKECLGVQVQQHVKKVMITDVLSLILK